MLLPLDQLEAMVDAENLSSKYSIITLEFCKTSSLSTSVGKSSYGLINLTSSEMLSISTSWSSADISFSLITNLVSMTMKAVR